MSLPYSDFYYPLNVFMHILQAEEGGVHSLHYALFDHPDEPIELAQQRSTDLLFARLPHPPARVLDVGIGLGTTMARLVRDGYDAIGITPDAAQVAMARQRHGPDLPIECAAFEEFTSDAPFDIIVFQESSQYIDSDALFANARNLTNRVLVLDEFALKTTDASTLHSLQGFLAAATHHGFQKTEELDLSFKAAPTVDYFTHRIPRYRQALKTDLGLTDQQVDELVANAHAYRQHYRDGVYGYRLLTMVAG